MESPFFVTVASALVLAFSMDKSGAPLQLLEIGPNMQCSIGLYLEQYGGEMYHDDIYPYG